jgi:ribonuclease P protein component
MQMANGLSLKNTSKKKFSLRYFERLHKREDFNRVFKNGLRVESKSIKILAYERNDCHCVRRLGIVTSKKIGAATVRNKIKRRLREIFRTSKHSLKPKLDLIFVLKQEVVSLNYNDLKKAVLDLVKKANLFLSSE